MAISNFPRLPRGADGDRLVNLLNELIDELEFRINGHLDVKNIRADGIEAKNIKAGAVTAAKIKVDELSAISANLGTITAGEVYGALIATSVAGTFPRIEFSSDNNLLTAQGNANEMIIIDPSVDGTPQLFFQDTSTGDLSLIFLSSSIFIIVTQAGTDISIAAGNDLNLQAGDGFHVNVQGWNKFYSTGDTQSLQQALNEKANSFTGFTGSFSTGTQTVNVVNGIITSVV